MHQRQLTPPQREYLNSKIDEMLGADIIEPCNPGNVKCVSPTTLAQKAHGNGGLNRDELLHRINDQCIAAGLPPIPDLPQRDETLSEPLAEHKNPKWAYLSKLWRTQQSYRKSRQMPQGDIRTKQQVLSGHRWISVFDFASGFYAVTVAEESRPYTCFYVEGRGYSQYKRMPFGLTGAPSTFAQVTATHLHDLIANGDMELFVDDGAATGDEFEQKIAKLTRIFLRVRERKLSLSASKSAFFMTTAIFAGANVGPRGVSPDLAKLTAIVNWGQPHNALNLSSFLGITGHFRDLIKGYSKLEAPLRDLLKAGATTTKLHKVILAPSYASTRTCRTMASASYTGIY